MPSNELLKFLASFGAEMTTPKIYADFHNADSSGRVRLNCVGSLEDLAEQRLDLHEGQRLTLYSMDEGENGSPDAMFVDGVVIYSSDEKCWVAAIDWNAIRHESDGKSRGSLNGSQAEAKQRSAQKKTA
jgi:hypothetical protein